MALKSVFKKITLGSVLLHLTLLGFGLLCLFPFLLVIATSLTDEPDLTKHGYQLIPPKISMAAYEYLLNDPAMIIRSYGITTSVTLLGTIIGLFITSMLAYALSRKDFPLARSFVFYVFFTMLFSGGLVPTYILVTRYLHLKDTIWALIAPYLVIPFFVLLLRSFFVTISEAIIESAKMEGAGEFWIYFRIILPLSLPALATVGLFQVLMYWNDWFLALLYIENSRLFPLQYILVSLMANIDFLSTTVTTVTTQALVPAESARMAMAIVATGPVIFIFIFLQKYFIRGLTVGAIKG